MIKKSFADSLAKYLEENIDPLIRGKTLFVGDFPENKGTFVLVTESGGSPPDQYIPEDNPTFQVACFGKQNEYSKTFEMAMEIFSLLNRKTNYIMDVRYVWSSRAIASPQSLGVDEKKRWQIVTNFLFKIRRDDEE